MKITDVHIAGNPLTKEVLVVTKDKRRKCENGYFTAQGQERTAEFIHALITLIPVGETGDFELGAGTTIRVTIEKV